MGERVPPAGDPKDHFICTTVTHDKTYVIQIPRDQVYRVPNAENARIIENHIKDAEEQKKRRCGPVCWIIIVVILLGIALGIAVAILHVTLYSPKSPQFSVVHVHTKHLDQDFTSKKKITPPEYEILLRANNPNKLISVAYRGPGKAVLNFNEQRLGNGGIRSTIKQEPDSPIDFPLILSGEGLPLSPGITNSLNNTKEIKAMNLKIEIPIEMNSWVKNEKKGLTVSCDINVQSSVLMNKARISSQECQVNL